MQVQYSAGTCISLPPTPSPLLTPSLCPSLFPPSPLLPSSLPLKPHSQCCRPEVLEYHQSLREWKRLLILGERAQWTQWSSMHPQPETNKWSTCKKNTWKYCQGIEFGRLADLWANHQIRFLQMDYEYTSFMYHTVTVMLRQNHQIKFHWYQFCFVFDETPKFKSGQYIQLYSIHVDIHCTCTYPNTDTQPAPHTVHNYSDALSDTVSVHCTCTLDFRAHAHVWLLT